MQARALPATCAAPTAPSSTGNTSRTESDSASDLGLVSQVEPIATALADLSFVSLHPEAPCSDASPDPLASSSSATAPSPAKDNPSTSPRCPPETVLDDVLAHRTGGNPLTSSALLGSNSDGQHDIPPGSPQTRIYASVIPSSPAPEHDGDHPDPPQSEFTAELVENAVDEDPPPAPASPVHQDAPPDDIPPSTFAIIGASCNVWFWRHYMILCAWLHLHFYVSHRAIALILAVTRIVFKKAGLLPDDTDTPMTLKTVFKRLNLDDRFVVAPMCPTCHRVYPASSLPSSSCSHCDVPLFKGSTITLETAVNIPFLWHTASAAKPSYKPVLQTPMRLPSTMLNDLINQSPNMEKDLDRWRHQSPDPLCLRCVQDGEIWRTIEGPDKRPFFDNSPDRIDADELRLGVTLGFDGCVAATLAWYLT